MYLIIMEVCWAQWCTAVIAAHRSLPQAWGQPELQREVNDLNNMHKVRPCLKKAKHGR